MQSHVRSAGLKLTGTFNDGTIALTVEAAEPASDDSFPSLVFNLTQTEFGRLVLGTQRMIRHGQLFDTLICPTGRHAQGSPGQIALIWQRPGLMLVFSSECTLREPDLRLSAVIGPHHGDSYMIFILRPILEEMRRCVSPFAGVLIFATPDDRAHAVTLLEKSPIIGQMRLTKPACEYGLWLETWAEPDDLVAYITANVDPSTRLYYSPPAWEMA